MAVAIRTGVVAASMPCTTAGVRTPNAATAPNSTMSGTTIEVGRSARITRSVAMLPSPLKKSTENSTTVSA